MRKEQGYSVKRLARELGIAASTASLWVRGVEMTAASNRMMMENAAPRVRRGQVALGAAHTAKAANRRATAYAEADAQWPELCADPLFMFGLAMYIGEGYKRGTTVGLVNSDIRALRNSLYFFRKVGLDLSSARVRVQAHSPDANDEIIGFWSTGLGVSASQFLKPYIKTSGGHRAHRIPMGTCAVTWNTIAAKHKIDRLMQLALGDVAEWSKAGDSKSP